MRANVQSRHRGREEQRDGSRRLSWLLLLIEAANIWTPTASVIIVALRRDGVTRYGPRDRLTHYIPAGLRDQEGRHYLYLYAKMFEQEHTLGGINNELSTSRTLSESQCLTLRLLYS